MHLPSFTWNPRGFGRLSFRDFRWLTTDPRQQLTAGLISMCLVIIGSLIAMMLPISNLNLIFYALIGYFYIDRVHRHPLLSAAVVTLSIIGLSWSLVMLVPDYFELPATLMLVFAANIFLPLFGGAVLATVTKAES